MRLVYRGHVDGCRRQCLEYKHSKSVDRVAAGRDDLFKWLGARLRRHKPIKWPASAEQRWQGDDRDSSRQSPARLAQIRKHRLGGGPINGTCGITLAGTSGVGGRVTLTLANTFSGGVAILAGQLNLQNGDALDDSSGVSVSYGASPELQSSGSGQILYGTSPARANPIPQSLAGYGVSGAGALTSVAGNNIYGGPITINLGSGGAAIASASSAAGDGLTLTGGVAVCPGTTLAISGAGPTIISSVPLNLAAAIFDGPASLTVAGPGTVQITSPPGTWRRQQTRRHGRYAPLRSCFRNVRHRRRPYNHRLGRRHPRTSRQRFGFRI
jgi:hypothetical protein